MGVFNKILHLGEGRKLKALEAIVPEVGAFEPEIQKLSDDQLAAKTAEFRNRLDRGEDLDDLLPEAFAVIREAAWRVLGQRHYDVQLMGGAALHFGWVAEMKTGEGKTLVATLPAYLNALGGQGVHLVTVNDYLAKRDCGWNGRIFDLLGMTTAAIVGADASGNTVSYLFDPTYSDERASDERLAHLRPIDRHTAYAADITYGTNSEFGFDYLRDNLAVSVEDKYQRGHNFAIVDEVDNILIDEARTPLILSGPAEETPEMYYRFAKAVTRLRPEEDYTVDEKMRAVSLT